MARYLLPHPLPGSRSRSRGAPAPAEFRRRQDSARGCHVKPAARRLFVCYVPGLDRRRLDPRITPFLCDLLSEFPAVTLETLPTTELMATLLTGAWPHEHGFWQVSLRRDVPRGPWVRLLERVPDLVTTTAQCLVHLVTRRVDLAAIPWRRRRHFQLHRFEYERCGRGDLRVGAESPMPGLFDLLGERATYRFTDRFEHIPSLLAECPSGAEFELIQFHAFDLLSHWGLDDPDLVRRSLREVDGLVEGLSARCREMGTRFMLLVDHGQEPITRRVDLVRALKETGIPRGEYHHYVEISLARLWFETDRARRAITAAVRSLPGVRVFTRGEMRRFHLEFEDDRYGELYLIAEHGSAFFPHDFYQPLANFYLGLSNRVLRPRIRDPRHRGNHGQMPSHPAERGFIVLSDPTQALETDRMRLIDFAPTVLGLLGEDPPPTMTGRPVYRSREGMPA